MASLADLNKQEKLRKKKKKEKSNKTKILLSKKTDDWEVLNNDHSSNLDKILEDLLKSARLEKFRYTWSELKAIPKEKRKQSKRAMIAGLDKEKYEASKLFRANFVFGINSVIRRIEKDNIWCCVVSPVFDPAMVINHIISLSKYKRVPLVILPNLESIGKRSVGFSIKALGIKKSNDSEIDPVFKEVYERVIQLSVSLDPAAQPSSDIPSKDTSQLPVEQTQISKLQAIKNKITKRKSFILKRENESSRCFIPGKKPCPAENSGFISFDTGADTDKQRSLGIKGEAVCDEDDDSDNSDSVCDSNFSIAKPTSSMKPYKPIFQPLLLKKMMPKS